MRFYISTLGCPKNEVDSEGMGRLLSAAGHEPVADPRDADALIVNTCGFIGKAREESLAELKRFAVLKRRTGGVCRGRATTPKLLIGTGCLSQRSPEQLLRAIPELDGQLGTLRWSEIAALLDRAVAGDQPSWLGQPRDPKPVSRLLSAPSAYLKIADGCDAGCAFCAIPLIKGPQRSKPIPEILSEARTLAQQGAREIVLIAQDTTAYGRDLGLHDGLAVLLEKLVAEVPEIAWLRLMYAHPAHIGDRLVEVIASHPQIVKYLDLPLQHADPAVLQRMRRPLNGPQVVKRLRDAIPEIAIRSAFIVGFPGETEAQFQRLLDFLAEMRFDRVGVFGYSSEDGTAAAALGPPVPARTMRSRYARAMEQQQRTSHARNRLFAGQVLDVLVEGAGESAGEYGAVGRSYRDAPEVDGLVFVRQRAPVGEIVGVKIARALPYDLVGDMVRNGVRVAS